MPLIYQNPVWSGYLADPFVLKWRGEYYAYGTGGSVGDEPQRDGGIFPVLHSKDFAHWEYLGGALEPLRNPAATAYWAPEVAERDGRFFMYYSAAGGTGDENHRLRVAVADHPAGPFVDTGHFLLPDEDFTIDAHPFRDPKDGQWYLFFAKDFFDERVGTGTAVVPLEADMLTAGDTPRTVLRASADWQIYARNRSIYGKEWEAWHTVEGPTVVWHDGLYYCFYSGGAWYTPDYGVGYGVAENVLGPYRDDWGGSGPSVLRGIEGKVLGPGHNSVVLGPDDRTQFMVYHAWDAAKTARRMFVDPLLWTPDGPRCAGPTLDPQPLPAS
jgi:GH43 family beta-xylosidase